MDANDAKTAVEIEVETGVEIEVKTVRNLRIRIEDAVRSCILGQRRTAHAGRTGHAGVAFSGGIDSSLIAAIAQSVDPDIELYTVGISDSHDVRSARRAAALLGLSDRLRVCECTEEAIESAIPEVLHATQSANPVVAGVGVCMYLVAQCAHKHGTGLLLTGQGADELFSGYKRYESAFDRGIDDLKRVLEKDLLALPDQIKRDTAVAKLFDVTLCTPIFSPGVVAAACRIDAGLKMRREGGEGSERSEYTRKYILRKVSEQYLPPELVWAPKKAAQYGTGVQGVLRRLARRSRVGQAEMLRRWVD